MEMIKIGSKKEKLLVFQSSNQKPTWKVVCQCSTTM